MCERGKLVHGCFADVSKACLRLSGELSPALPQRDPDPDDAAFSLRPRLSLLLMADSAHHSTNPYHLPPPQRHLYPQQQTASYSAANSPTYPAAAFPAMWSPGAANSASGPSPSGSSGNGAGWNGRGGSARLDPGGSAVGKFESFDDGEDDDDDGSIGGEGGGAGGKQGGEAKKKSTRGSRACTVRSFSTLDSKGGNLTRSCAGLSETQDAVCWCRGRATVQEVQDGRP